MRWALLLVAAYLLGSVSFSYLVVRAIENLDVRSLGSGNAGATNVLRVAGPWPAAAVFVLDVGKGVAAAAAAVLLEAPPVVTGGTVLAVTLGHSFPLFFGFRGGKGVATAAGAMAVIAPLALAAAAALFALVVSFSRYVSAGSVVSTVAFPLFAALLPLPGPPEARPAVVVTGAVLAALVIARHRSNLRRLFTGREARLGRVYGGDGAAATKRREEER